MLKNVPVYENGGRAATTTFLQRQIGDVLVTFESNPTSRLNSLVKAMCKLSIQATIISAENPVAIVKSVTDKKAPTTQRKRILIIYGASLPSNWR